MWRKVFWETLIVAFALLIFSISFAEGVYKLSKQGGTNSNTVYPLWVPERISQQPVSIKPDQTEPLPYEKGYCVIQNDNDTAAYYYDGFVTGEGLAVYMDPAQCGADPYPFKITQVHFHLYDPGGYVWPAEIKINIKTLVQGDKCNGPGDSLYSEIHTIPSDSGYPNLVHLDLDHPYWVTSPFFLEIIYTGGTNPPYPSLLMTETYDSPDTCSDWVRLYYGGSFYYYEWYEAWESPPPGNAIIRAAGYTAEPCTTVFTHLDTTWVPWGKVDRFTNDRPLLGFSIDCIKTPDSLKSVTVTSFIEKAFSIDTLRLYAETNEIKGLQVPGDDLIRQINTYNFQFDSNDTLKFSNLNYPLEYPGSNKFYIAINTHSDSIGASPPLYDGHCLELLIRPGRIVLNSGKTNPDSIYNRPYGGIGDDSTGFCPNDPFNPGYPNCRYRLCFDICPFTTYLPMRPGWQWVSTNVDPDPSEMESLFVNCWDDLDIIKACDGSFCIPGVGCWIPGWNVREMYKVRMANACTIQVCGNKVPTNTPIILPGNWNCIAYFPECPLEPEIALASIWDNLDIVKNDGGEFCIPGVACWIECLEYHKGYKVHVSALDTLIYPTSCPPCPPPFAKENHFSGFAKTTHFSYLEKTGESYSIVVNSVELIGKSLEVGDEIAVFTPSGLCVGGGVWQGEILGMALWQDDDQTEAIDGFKVGDEMIFKLWDKSENKEIELSASFDKGNGKFGTVADPASGGNAYALINLKGSTSPIPKEFKLAQNYPNPFNPETEISYALPKECDVKLTIYNMLGQKIKVLVDEHQTAGYRQVFWNGKDDKGGEVASGIYFYKLDAGEFTQTRRMVLIK